MSTLFHLQLDGTKLRSVLSHALPCFACWVHDWKHHCFVTESYVGFSAFHRLSAVGPLASDFALLLAAAAFGTRIIYWISECEVVPLRDDDSDWVSACSLNCRFFTSDASCAGCCGAR